MRANGKSLVVGLAFCTAGMLGAATPALGATDREIAQADLFRSSMGLDAGETVARQSFDQRAKYSDLRYGVPLTPNEAAEIDRRLIERPQVQEAIDYAISEDTSAGMYFDQLDGGKPIFLFTENVGQQADAIQRHLPNGVDFDVRKVDYPTSRLRQVQEEIVADFRKLQAQGLPIAQVGVVAEGNHVLVGLEYPSPGTQATLRDRYGPMVSTEVVGPSVLDVCNSRSDCRPIKGGLKMGRGGEFLCTTGFNGVRRDNGNHVVLTAGHCLALNGGVQNCEPLWKHNGNVFGCAKGESLPANPNTDAEADVGWILTDDGVGDDGRDNEDIAPRHFFYTYENNVDAVGWVMGGSDLQENDILCRSGGTSGWTCGKLLQKCVKRVTSGNWHIKCVAEVKFDSTGGDSGGPVVRPIPIPPYAPTYAAAGIHSHSTDDGHCEETNDCRSWFTKASRIEQYSPADICTTSACPQP